MKFEKFRGILGKIGDFLRNSYKFVKIKVKRGKKRFFEFFDKEDRKAITQFSSDVLMNGIAINFFLFYFFNLSFNWYSWFFIGLFWRFIKKEAITHLRRLWFKNSY
ncbi:MAG: hypothetical protein ACOC5T_04180 [Elusimicrobiota bacterium]